MSNFVLLVFLFFSGFSWAQSKPHPYRAQVLADGVQVYKTPDFDAPVIAILSRGKIYDVSSKKHNGAFYRLRLKPGLLGYVSDVDVKPLFKESATNKKLARKEPDSEREPLRKKSFQYTQFAGFQYAQIGFRENTMGDRRDENLGFFGAKISGPNLVIEGQAPTEMNFLFHVGAPGYYEKLTGRPADGWILMMDFLFQNYYPQGRDVLTFFGFGPMLRYSKFNLSLTDSGTGKISNYSAEDINLGAVFNVGGALRFNRIALRGEAQYYWEKLSYLGYSLSLQFAF